MSAPSPARQLPTTMRKETEPSVRSSQLGLNFVLLTSGEFISKLLTFVAFSRLARLLGPTQYGMIEFALAVMVFFTLPADLGLGAYGAREIAKHRERGAELLSEIVEMRFLLTVISFCFLLVFTWTIHKGTQLKLLLTMYSFSLLASAFLLQWFFQAYEKMHWVALASIIRQLVFAAMVLFFVKANTNILFIGGIECISVSAVALFSLYVVAFRMHVRLPRLNIAIERALRHLRGAVAIGSSELAWAFMWYFATVLLGLVFDHVSLGWFGASHRLLMATHTFVWLYFFNLLPSLSRCTSAPRSQLMTLMDHSMSFAAWAGLLAAFLGTAVSREALTLIYGPGFSEAGSCFAVLVWMIPVAMLSGHYRYALLAYNLQNQLLWSTVASAAVAVVAGLRLVPAFGPLGAAWALLTANVVNFILVYFIVRRHIAAVPFLPHLIHPLIAMAAATAVFLLVQKHGVWLAAGCGGITYLAGVAAMQWQRAVLLARLFLRDFSESELQRSLAA